MSSGKTTIGFSGDFSFSGYFSGCFGDDGLLDDGIKAFLAENDYNVINFESPITPCRITKKRRLAHRSAPEVLGFVKEHIPHAVLSFANNHMMDFGPIGVVDTIDACKQYDIPCIGIGLDIDEAAKYLILGDEVKVGVLAVEYKKHLIAGENSGGPLHESSVEVIKSRLEKLKAQTDHVVLVYHGGEEFMRTPMPYTRRQLKKYLDWGADVVVAHHPHVVQGFELMGKKAIFYSLGNFVFDTSYQRVQEDTDKGMLLSLSFDKNGFTYKYLPTFIDRANKRVTVGEDIAWFEDIRNGYDKHWSREAARRVDVKERARLLREEELAKIAEHQESELVRLAEVQLRADIAEAKEAGLDYEPEEEEAAEEEAAEAPRKARRHMLRRLYRKLIVQRKENHKKFVLNVGKLKAKTIYK